MANDNFWDWDNGDERIVSSVYKDTEQNDIAQNMETQNVEPQPHTTQDLEREENQIADRTEENTEVQNIEIQNCDTPNDETKNDFILVDNPHNMIQNPTPQSDISYAQTEYQENEYQQNVYQQNGHQQNDYQQNNFQQMIPVQNIQQNQDTNRQKAKQNKNTDYSSNFNPKDISENKVSAMTAYLLGPIGIIIALLIARDSPYTAFHVRQALKLTVSSVTLELVAAILALFAMIPLVGIIFKLVLVIIGAMWFGVLVLRLIAIAQVCDGEAREPAIIGKMNCFH